MEQLRGTLVSTDRRIRRVLNAHAALADAVAGALVALLALLEAALHGRYRYDPTWLVPFPLGAAVAYRRRWPVATYLAVFGIISTSANEIPLTSFFALLIAGYSLAAYGRTRLLNFLVLLASALFVTIVFHSDLSFLPRSSVGFIVLGTLWLTGSAVRSRQRRADESEDRARRLEREQDQARQLALAAERARIARELHDVVTHNVSVMVVQAGAARLVMERDQDKATGALLSVEARGREALAELRGFLGVLEGSARDDPELSPQPGTDDLVSLVQGVNDAGLPVTLAVVGDPRPLPHGVDLAAYRVVQEGLTNAMKYAHGAATEVVVMYRSDELAVEVLDQGPGHGESADEGGRGLSGLRERLAVYGGRLESGRRPSGGFAVRAWIPTSAP